MLLIPSIILLLWLALTCVDASCQASRCPLFAPRLIRSTTRKRTARVRCDRVNFVWRLDTRRRLLVLRVHLSIHCRPEDNLTGCGSKKPYDFYGGRSMWGAQFTGFFFLELIDRVQPCTLGVLACQILWPSDWLGHHPSLCRIKYLDINFNCKINCIDGG